MKGDVFVEKVRNKKITNGSKFEVFNSDNKKILNIGVIDTTVVFLDSPEVNSVPEDLYTDKYTFIKTTIN